MITIIIRYKGNGDNAKRFVEEMVSSGLANTIRSEEVNLRYEFLSSR